MSVLYVDSNVLISYIKSEFGGVTRAQVIRVKDFLSKCSLSDYELVLSDLTLNEIRKIAYLEEDEVKQLLSGFGIKFKIETTTKGTIELSRVIEKKTGIHRPDSIHVALAVQSKSDFIITWNIKDFVKANIFVKSITPDQL